MKSEFFKVEILSPVHIGTGDQVDPFHYLIDDKNLCHFIDPGAWAAEHPDPEELLKQFSGGNIAQMRAYLAEQVDPSAYAERSCRVVGDKIIADYKKHLGQPESRNQLLLSPNLVGGGGGPLLPGSSLKGAIRTAVIDWLDREKHLQLKSCRTSREQGDKLKPFFGEITDNSFRELKVADCEAHRDSSLVVEAREVRRNPEKAVTPKAHCEVLASHLLGDRQQATLATRIALGRPGSSAAVIRLKTGEEIDWPRLCELVNSYSAARYRKEQVKFWNLPHFAKAREALAKIETNILNPPAGSMVFKVGHYSQVEYVTVEQNRPQTRRAKGGGNLPHGTTRTLADGRFPFGWVLLSPCCEEEYREILTQRDSNNLAVLKRQDELRNQRREAARQQREAYMQKRAAEEARRKAAEERAREEAAKPWLVWVRQLASLNDWGGLKQLLEREDVTSQQQQPELAQAVLDAALRVKEHRPGKWDQDRRDLVNKWLEGSGLCLPGDDTPVETDSVPEDVSRVEALADFGAWCQSGLSIESLSVEALVVLRERMKSWGCADKKAKKNKQAAYKKVVKALQNR